MTILDGGFGTMLQAAGLPAGKDPADWNVENPAAVKAVHRAYVESGSDVVVTNTFGANRLKYHGAHALGDVIRAAVENARTCAGEQSAHRVALDVGPTGRLLTPAGDLSFDEAVAAFSEEIRIGAEAGADLVLVETIGDVHELKAAVVAAKESCSLPIWATVALGEDGKLLTGGSVACVSALLESLGVDAYGFNCGLGPDRMLPFVEELASLSTRPIIVKPNAGMPTIVDGRTVFPTGPAEFAACVARLVDAGASIAGGCCGTTPEHIGKLASGFSSRDARVSPVGIRQEGREGQEGQTGPKTAISSGTVVVTLTPHQGLIIGERINPTGKKLLKEAYAKGDTAYVLREAVKQVDAGAEILDVNCGVPGLDETTLLASTVRSVQSVVTAPIQIDTADPSALEGALRRVNGKPLVNSVNGKRVSMDAVFPLVKKYGGAVVALCLDETGIPPTAEGRLAIARKILAEGRAYGLRENDFVFDALTLSVSADPQAALVTLETVRRLTDELHVNTVLGVSNVSFGLPNRPALNNAMYVLAKRAGLSAAIANPAAIHDEIDPAAEDVLMGRDANCAKWIGLNTEAQRHRVFEGMGVEPPGKTHSAGQLCDSVSLCLNNLAAAIRRGLREDARVAAAEMLKGGAAPLEVIEKGIVPALEQVGKGFEKGSVFLPQLLMAADAAGEAFAVVKKLFDGSDCSIAGEMKKPAAGGNRTITQSEQSNKTIVLATVKGDIHDIGKNIVRALLENYGFDVIDLGRDVAPETIVEAARKNGAALVGLSALMTTTVGAMAETVRQLKASGLGCKTVVGGAVVTEEYAASIGADYYAKDAMRTVRIAGEVVSPEK